ncbi:L,D-transpeptidase [Streptomyces sp. NPDC005953]|uniref:L,D-transpeptidase n=1 Tax=Streptomyces sp. NPDC005953 TaxID=3156719 RepID=UPI0033FB77B3
MTDFRIAARLLRWLTGTVCLVALTGTPAAASGSAAGQTDDGPRTRSGPVSHVLGTAPRPELKPSLPQDAATCTTSTGPYQEEVEDHLGLVVDGVQSAGDCSVIQEFQRKLGIVPDQGYAGLFTYRAVMWERAVAEGDAIAGCPDTSGTVVCVDMNRQILWVEDAGKVIFRPVPARTGSPDYPTRTGWHQIFDRQKEFWSTLYEGPMPFAQFFDGGQALHGSYRNIWEDPGSHGCVNLRYDEAKALWNGLRLGDEVYVWGRRTGG